MVVARRARPFRTIVAVAALAYLLVVAVVPALHHDFQCHVQHPGHCDACRAVVASPDVTGHGPALAPNADHSGSVAPDAPRATAAPGLRPHSGRAPPFAS